MVNPVKTITVVMEANVMPAPSGFGMYQLGEAENMNNHHRLALNESYSIEEFIAHMSECHSFRYERHEEIEGNIHDGSAAYKIIRTDMEDIQEGISCLWEVEVAVGC